MLTLPIKIYSRLISYTFHFIGFMDYYLSHLRVNDIKCSFKLRIYCKVLSALFQLHLSDQKFHCLRCLLYYAWRNMFMCWLEILKHTRFICSACHCIVISFVWMSSDCSIVFKYMVFSAVMTVCNVAIEPISTYLFVVATPIRSVPEPSEA